MLWPTSASTCLDATCTSGCCLCLYARRLETVAAEKKMAVAAEVHPRPQAQFLKILTPGLCLMVLLFAAIPDKVPSSTHTHHLRRDRHHLRLRRPDSL